MECMMIIKHNGCRKELVAVICEGSIYFRTVKNSREKDKTIKIQSDATGYKTYIELEQILIDRLDAKGVYKGDEITLKF